MINEITCFEIDDSGDNKARFKEIRRKLRGFNKKKLDISLVRDDIYREVEAIIFDSDFKYVNIIHYLVRFGIPLQDRLLEALLDRTYSAPHFQNDAEEHAFRICKEFFPEAVPNVHLGGLGGIEMDILLPHRRVDIEIDKISSPKRNITIEQRRNFLEENFNIRVYRYAYGGDERRDGIEVLCEQIYGDIGKIF